MADQKDANSNGPAPPPKPERPRDELGRPLPPGSENRLTLENFDALDLEQNERLAVRYFNEANFFGAHEAWETCWNASRGGPDEEFFKGLAQLGAGYTHYRRGNARGAAALLERGASRIMSYGRRHRGVDVAALVEATSEHARVMQKAAEAGTVPPRIVVPQLAPITVD